MRIVGVDPGAKGGLALLDDGTLLAVEQMPALVLKRGKSNKTEVDDYALAELLRRWHAEAPIDLGIVENVGGREGQSASAAFNFGFACGAPRFMLIGMGLRVEKVAPQTWMRALSVPPGKDKDGSFALANRLFPGWSRTWSAVVGNGPYDERSGRAEAALIAWWGRQHFEVRDASAILPPAERENSGGQPPARRERTRSLRQNADRSAGSAGPARRPSLFD